MTSQAYRENYKLIDWSKPIEPARRERSVGPRSDLPLPHVLSDNMSPVQGQHDGQMYDSKSRLRASYREHGLIEVGNDPARFRKPEKPKPDRKAIRVSLERAMARVS